jgi:molybdenum cofactor guanylyltransferase
MQTGGDATTRPLAPPAAGVVGVVLAGGRSRRMGQDKAMLTAGGPPLAELAARRLLAVCGEVLIADGQRQLVAGFLSLPDQPVQGPAGGILAAAAARPGQPLLVLACDLPRVPVALLAMLAGRASRARGGRPGPAGSGASPAVPGRGGSGSPARPAADLVVPRWRRGIEPLCALYQPAALAALAAAVRRGDAAPHRLRHVPGLKVGYLEGPRLRRLGPPEELFLNLNTPLDLDRWLALRVPE